MKQLMLVLAAVAVAFSANAKRDEDRINNGKFRDFGFQSEEEMKQYFTIADVQIEEVKTPMHVYDVIITNPSAPVTAPGATTAPAPSAGDVGGSIIGVITDPTSLQNWVVLGQKIWEIVIANRPVANVSTKRVSVLPMSEADWVQMTDWKAPYTKTYRVGAVNGFGSKVMILDYTVAFNHGGKFQGKGQYLANATVIPAYVSVSWGFRMDANVEVGTVLNTGSGDEPVPGVDMQLKWKMDSILRHMEGTESFFVRGDGTSAVVSSSYN